MVTAVPQTPVLTPQAQLASGTWKHSQQDPLNLQNVLKNKALVIDALKVHRASRNACSHAKRSERPRLTPRAQGGERWHRAGTSQAGPLTKCSFSSLHEPVSADNPLLPKGFRFPLMPDSPLGTVNHSNFDGATIIPHSQLFRCFLWNSSLCHRFILARFPPSPFLI